MDKKIYIIGAFTNGKQAQRYLDSLSVLGDNVKPILVQYLRRGKFDKFNKPEKVRLIKYKKNYPGNTGKHKDFREILSPLLDPEAWYLVTDIHDVIFQAPLPDFPPAQIFVASEGKKFGEIRYWKEIFPPEVWDWEVYNVGCFAIKGKVLKEFWEYLYTNWMEFHQWYKQGTVMRIGHGDSFPFNIPFHERVKVEMALMFNAHYDTLCFNHFLRKYTVWHLSGLFGCYAYQVKEGNLKYRDGKLYQNDKLVSVAHFNGNTKRFMKKGA